MAYDVKRSLIDTNSDWDWFLSGGEARGVDEFNAFFEVNCYRGTNYHMLSLKAIQQCNLILFNLPGMKYAMDRLASQIAGREIAFKIEGDKKPSKKDEELLEEFKKTLYPNPVKFQTDLVELMYRKGGCVVSLFDINKDKKRKGKQNRGDNFQDTQNNPDPLFRFFQIPPERHAIGTESKDINIAKYSLKKYYIVNDKTPKYTLLNPKLTLYCTPSTTEVVGVPPLLYNHIFSSGLVSSLKKWKTIQDQPYMNKSILTTKESIVSGDKVIQTTPKSTDDMKKFKKTLKSFLNSSHEHALHTKYDIVKTDLDVNGDEEFIKNYNLGAIMHTAYLTGLPPYQLLDPSNLNRDTIHHQYNEFYLNTLQPQNKKLSGVFNAMFKMWLSLNDKSEATGDLEIHIPPAPSRLNIDLSASDLKSYEEDQIVQTNEVRELVGLRDYTTKELAERQELRKKKLEKPTFGIPGQGNKPPKDPKNQKDIKKATK